MLVYLLLLLLCTSQSALVPLFCEAVFPPIKTLRKEQRNDDAWRFFVSSCVVGSADARAEKTDWSE